MVCKVGDVEEVNSQRTDSHIILIVEDNADDAYFIQRYIVKLFGNKYSIVVDSQGENVGDLLAERRIDAVISDYRLPRTDGLQVYNQVSSRVPNLPFILLMDDENPARKYVPDNLPVLSKNLGYNQLARSIDELMSAHSDSPKRQTHSSFEG